MASWMSEASALKSRLRERSSIWAPSKSMEVGPARRRVEARDIRWLFGSTTDSVLPRGLADPLNGV